MKTLEDLNFKAVVLSRKEIEKEELDWETDLKDLVCGKLGVEDCVEKMSGWDISGENYTVVVKA